jgi:hypothetical protein
MLSRRFGCYQWRCRTFIHPTSIATQNNAGTMHLAGRLQNNQALADTIRNQLKAK